MLAEQIRSTATFFMKLHLQVPSTSPFFVPFKNGFNGDPMVLFTHNVKKIKGAAHKNGDVDGRCKRGLRIDCVFQPISFSNFRLLLL